MRLDNPPTDRHDQADRIFEAFFTTKPQGTGSDSDL
jgi:hypothetical protein